MPHVADMVIRRAQDMRPGRLYSRQILREQGMHTGSGFPEPQPNVEVRDPVTGIAYFIDRAYPRWKIAIEYDSEEHRLNKERWQKDLHKDEVLHAQEWMVLRVSIADFQRL